jgi:hypothetical protein
MRRIYSVMFSMIILLVSSGYTECYKPAGRGDALPKHIKTVAIPAFQNSSLRYKVEQRSCTARRYRTGEIIRSYDLSKVDRQGPDEKQSPLPQPELRLSRRV